MISSAPTASAAMWNTQTCVSDCDSKTAHLHLQKLKCFTAALGRTKGMFFYYAGLKGPQAPLLEHIAFYDLGISRVPQFPLTNFSLANPTLPLVQELQDCCHMCIAPTALVTPAT